MNYTRNPERHFVLEEIESCLKAQLETPIDQGPPEQLIDREYPEIRSEIARQTAGLIREAKYGVVEDLARLIRTAVNSWRLLQQVEEKAKRTSSRRLHGDYNNPAQLRTTTLASRVDTAWRNLGRILVVGYRTRPPR